MECDPYCGGAASGSKRKATEGAYEFVISLVLYCFVLTCFRASKRSRVDIDTDTDPATHPATPSFPSSTPSTSIPTPNGSSQASPQTPATENAIPNSALPPPPPPRVYYMPEHLYYLHPQYYHAMGYLPAPSHTLPSAYPLTGYLAPSSAAPIPLQTENNVPSFRHFKFAQNW